jgi:voltage-gated potassium channel
MPVARLERRLTRGIANLTLRRAVLLIVTVATVLAVGAATLERLFDPAIGTYGDALWWAVSTVSTVGYGDVVPTSPAGRIIGTVLMLTGLGLIPLLTSAVVSALVAQRSREAREAELRDLAQILERLNRIEERLSG